MYAEMPVMEYLCDTRRFGVKHIDIGEGVTTPEYEVAETRHGGWYGDGLQRTALPEHSTVYYLKSLRQSDMLQCETIAESITA